MPKASPPRNWLPHRPATWVMVAAVVGGMISAGNYTKPDELFLFLGTGFWALAIVMLPVAMDRDYDPFSMWSFVILTVAIGMSLRGACLTFGFPDPERLDQLYLLGEEPAYFLPAAIGLLVGLLMLTLGFISRSFPPRAPRRTRNYHGGRLVALCLILLVLSSVATFLFVQRTGGLVSGDWSAKRTVIPDLELAGSGYRSHGGLRFVASLAIFGHVLMLAMLFSRGQGRLSIPSRVLLAGLAIALLVVACMVPFYASLRTHLVMNLLISAAMIHYADLRRRLALIAGLAGAVLLAVYLMTVLRPGGPMRSESELTRPTLARIFEAAVINRNQIELPKTAHIINAVPEKLPWQRGRTITRWLLAPIPRSLWPDKPVIPPGPEIGRAVYGQRVAGVPPSFVAEWYWNFHWPGVLIGAFGMGILLRYLQSRFQPDTQQSPDLFKAAVYVVGPMALALESIGGSIGSGFFRAAIHTVVMLGLLAMVRVHQGRPRAAR